MSYIQLKLLIHNYWGWGLAVWPRLRLVDHLDRQLVRIHVSALLTASVDGPGGAHL